MNVALVGIEQFHFLFEYLFNMIRIYILNDCDQIQKFVWSISFANKY